MLVSDRNLAGWVLQTQDLYEIELQPNVTPKNGDGEVAELALRTIDEVRDFMTTHEFKPNCNMTWLAFLIHNGYLTAENEPDFLEICARMHRKHCLFVV